MSFQAIFRAGAGSNLISVQCEAVELPGHWPKKRRNSPVIAPITNRWKAERRRDTWRSHHVLSLPWLLLCLTTGSDHLLACRGSSKSVSSVKGRVGPVYGALVRRRIAKPSSGRLKLSRLVVRWTSSGPRRLISGFYQGSGLRGQRRSWSTEDGMAHSRRSMTF